MEFTLVVRTFICVQGLTLGLILFPLFFKFILQVSGCFKFVDISKERANHEMKRSFIFYASLAFLSIVVVPSWVQFVLDCHMHPFLWYSYLKLIST